ncbi:MAG TPA: hypothetical protein VNZ03_25405 [Terriglobales bacterium]|nr:hypothetical protein [Terriglobales bacterium]
MKRFAKPRFCIPAALVVILLACASAPLGAQTLCSSGVCVLTWQNDTYRTGDNLQESVLNHGTIAKKIFGQRCSAQLDGQVYGQPLVLTNVNIDSTTYPFVVYVVTQNDTLYQIDGDPQHNCTVINKLPFLSTQGLPTYGQFPKSCKGCIAVSPIIGILGTPVININNGVGTIYLVTESQDQPTRASTSYAYLYAVDVQSLAVKQSVHVCASGCGQFSSSQFAHDHIQRTGLLFANCGSGCQNKNYVYAGFSMRDAAPTPYPFGAIFGYNADDLNDPNVFYIQTSQGTTGQDGGGIWMGGAAPAFGTDSSGQSWIYVTTANGVFDLNNSAPPNTEMGDSFLKLDPNGLALAAPSGGYGYFTPVDQYYRSFYSPACNNFSGDVDFGSGGVMLIPDHQLPNWPNLALSGDKEGGLWFVDRTNLGGFDTSCSNNPCSCRPTQSGNNIETYWTTTPYQGKNIHGGEAFWQFGSAPPFRNYLFAAAGEGQVIRYLLCADSRAKGPIDTKVCPTRLFGSVDTLGHRINFPYGVTPSISANGQARDAVVWAIKKPDGHVSQGTIPGIFYAFDAVTMKELYNSNQCTMNKVPVDQIAPATKFSVPTVANGFVYVGAQGLQNGVNNGSGTFYIFGSLPPRTCD